MVLNQHHGVAGIYQLVQHGDQLLDGGSQAAEPNSVADTPENATSGSEGQETSRESETTPDEVKDAVGVAEAPTDGDAESQDDTAAAVTAEPADDEGRILKASESEPVGDEQTEQYEETDENKRDSTTN